MLSFLCIWCHSGMDCASVLPCQHPNAYKTLLHKHFFKSLEYLCIWREQSLVDSMSSYIISFSTSVLSF